MKTLILMCIGLITFGSITGYSQNLVPNGDFESYNPCPTSTVPWGNTIEADDWEVPNTHLGESTYFNACAPTGQANVPDNWFGTQTGRNGSLGYCGLALGRSSAFSMPNLLLYQEYIQVKLTSPLIAGRTYQAEMFINVAENSQFNVNGMSMLFTQTAVTNPNSLFMITGYSQSSATPAQVYHPNVVNDSIGWVRVFGEFVADGGEEWLTIGMFDHTSTVVIDPTAPPIFGGPLGHHNPYYYFDDISVYECGAPQSISIGQIDCNTQWQIQLPGYGDPNTEFTPFGNLPAGAISLDGSLKPDMAGPGNWVVKRVEYNPNGCNTITYIHFEIMGNGAPMSIPLGRIDCDAPPILLPGAGDPFVSYTALGGLDPASISANGEFYPGIAGAGNWQIHQTIGTGLCAVTNMIDLEVVTAEGAIPKFIGPFCEGEGFFYEIPGGGTFEIFQSPIHDMLPHPLPNGVISSQGGFSAGTWQINQTITTPGGCEMLYVYIFDVIDCDCGVDIDISLTQNAEDCQVYDIVGSINYNGMIPVHYKWTIGNQNYVQTIHEGYNSSPYLNTSHDYGELNYPVWGNQVVCFEIWSSYPESEGIDSYCRECFQIDLCQSFPELGFIMNPQNVVIDKKNDNLSLQSTLEPVLVPNPTNGVVTLSGINQNNDISVRVYNILGEVVMDKQVYRQSIDISSQPKGLYFVEVFEQNKTHVIKLIKE